MSKPIAVEGVQFEIYEAGLLNPTGVVTVNEGSITSQTDTVAGKKIYADSLLVDVASFTSTLVAGWIAGSGNTTSPAPITSTAAKVKTGDGIPFLEGDQATAVVITGQIPSISGTQPATTVVDIKIKSGAVGQNVVNAT